jgi:uridine kinase
MTKSGLQFEQQSTQPEAIKLSFRRLMEPLLVLFNKAVGEVLTDKRFYIAYSIPGGVYGFFDHYEVSKQQLEAISLSISTMIANKERIRHETLPTDYLLQYFEKHERADIVDLIRSKTPHIESEGFPLAHLNGYGEFFPNYISEDYERLQHFRLLPFGKGFFLVADPVFFERVMPAEALQSKYFRGFEETEETMKHLGIASFAELNDIISGGRLPEFIKLSEAWQTRRISQIADTILSDKNSPRVIFLAGPTSSGKTTSAKRLAIELRIMKKQVHILSLDNYYLPHNQIPDDPNTGIKNFELITALDLKLFRKNINDLLAGKAVRLPRYHFDGKGAIPERQATQITPDTYLIVEGIHGLNPGLWHDVMDVDSFRLYVSALSTLNIHDHLPLSTSDNRLMRRMIRDHLFRGYGFNETISRWPDIMQNEYQSIFPYQESAHAIFNSALVYEPAIFAHYAPQILQSQNNEDELISEEVKRIIRLLSLLIPIDPTDIPPTSIIREFIGGSSFNY